MMTIEEERVRTPLPKAVCLYFMHGNTLTYEKTAFLYANIIQFQEETSEIYNYYRDKMQEFGWEPSKFLNLPVAERAFVIASISVRCDKERKEKAKLESKAKMGKKH